jgi:hypothetical protein
MEKMKKLYPSSSGFCWGDMVITEYDSGCLRSILCTANGYRKDIPETSMELGRRWEDIVFEQLVNEQPWPFHKELPFKHEIYGITISGRCDYIVYDDQGPLIIECKGTGSKTAPTDIIKNGKYKINHLAQVSSYFLYFGASRAKLMISYLCQQSRTFNITVGQGGVILVDGKSSGFTLSDQLKHTENAATVITEGVIWQRPHTMKGDPCRFCNHKEVCDRWDRGEIATTADFIEAAKLNSGTLKPKEN